MSVVDIRSALRTYLLADGPISALVGGSRVYPVKLDQGIVAPSIVYSRISGLGDHHNQGPSGLARSRMQIDNWAQSADVAANLANLVKARVDGFRGTMATSSGSPTLIKVRAVFFDSERDDYDNTASMYRVSQDYFIWFAES